MTRQFNDQYHCDQCGLVSTRETHFGRWLRNNPDLDSVGQGIVIYDIDYIVHKYRSFLIDGKEEFAELIMFVEVKTRYSSLTDEQRDTFLLVNQIIENRRSNNSTKNRGVNKLRQSRGPLRVYSSKKKAWVRVYSFGFFTLRFSHTHPFDSDSIYWNKKQITADQLTSILRFDIEPNTLKPMGEYVRKHHKKSDKKQSQLVLPIDESEVKQHNVQLN